MSNAIDTLADIDVIMHDICINTPTAVPLRADLMASEMQDRLNSQYGEDGSNVRAMLTFRKLVDMAQSHLRRSFDPDKTAEDEQLAFTEFGDDIQSRYPIKAKGEKGTVTEYQSPMYAPAEQLAVIAEKEIRVGSTRVRRGNALMAFLVEYRGYVTHQG